MRLPDPLRFAGGRPVTTQEAWRERRKEILALFEDHVYGRAPGPPEELRFEVVGEEGARRTTRITSRHHGREHAFELERIAPPGVERPPVFLFLNHRVTGDLDAAARVLARGYAYATISLQALAPDDPFAYRAGVMRLFEHDARLTWKTIGAWAWGATRAMDALARDDRIDASRVAVIGHSRGGKTALWAAAQDERIALAISNESGMAGAKLSRRRVGESVERINVRFPHWFADAFRAYDDHEESLPVDQHMLLALCAPRAVAVGSASDNAWADPEGEFLGLAHASSIYALHGFAAVPLDAWPRPGGSIFVAPRWYHLRVGTHDLAPWDWDRYLDAADLLWNP